MTGKYLFWFEELGKEHFNLVGKKCANIGDGQNRAAGSSRICAFGGEHTRLSCLKRTLFRR